MTNPTDATLDRARRYAVTTLFSEGDGCYMAQAAEWPFMVGAGESPEEAVAVLTELLADAIEVLEAQGERPPEPFAGYTGQLQLRLPRWVHGLLARHAEREGVSLNAAATALLVKGLGAEGVGPMPRPRPRPPRARAEQSQA